MTKMNQKEREIFFNIIEQDLSAINSRVVEQIEQLWIIARNELIEERGLETIREEKEVIKEKINELRQKLSDLEDQLTPEPLTVHQAIELGAKPNKFDDYRGAHFFCIPVQNEFDYAIIQKIKERVDTESPAKYLSDLASSALREIAMAGTFEEAQKIYEDFYALDFRKYGVDIPPRLKELREAKEESQQFLLGYAKDNIPKLESENKDKKKDEPKEEPEIA